MDSFIRDNGPIEEVSTPDYITFLTSERDAHKKVTTRLSYKNPSKSTTTPAPSVADEPPIADTINDADNADDVDDVDDVAPLRI